MKKALIALVSILVFGAVAVITCPNKQAHKDAIMSVINERINDELKTDDPEYQQVSVGVFGVNIE